VTGGSTAARPGMLLGPGDVLTGGHDAEILAVTGRDAFLVRAQSRLEFSAAAGEHAISVLRLVTGALLSVFPPGTDRRIETPMAWIGIRGTGLYVEIEAVRTYVCTCYGTAELTPVDAPRAAETVRTTYHDEPRYIYRGGEPRLIEKAPVINHTDAELILLEGLVGRKVPFVPGGY
jgi:hypothetical protein